MWSQKRFEHIILNKTDNKIIINEKKRQMKYQRQEEVKAQTRTRLHHESLEMQGAPKQSDLR